METALRSDRFFKQVTENREIFGLYCHSCSNYSLYEKSSEKKLEGRDCKHCDSSEVEKNPWWVIKKEMKENRSLQIQYSNFSKKPELEKSQKGGRE